MAYPTVSAPYGLKPINLIGGQVFAGATRKLPIASGYNTNIFYGDIVTLVAGGTIEKSNIQDESSPVAGLVGVFLGCSYVNSSGQTVFAQYFPAGTTVPAGLPMGGTTLPDFAPWDGIEVAVAQLDVDDVPTMEQSPLDQFEFWWNFMWCLVFAFWLIREFYGLVEAGDFEDLSEHMGASRKMDRGIYAYRGLVQTRNKIDRSNLRKTQASIVHQANARTNSIKRAYKVKGY